MSIRRRKLRQEESHTWIAYTDLLTTLLTFFVILSFAGMIRVRSLEAMTDQLERANLSGEVLDGTSKQLIPEASVQLAGSVTKTNQDGKFFFRDLDLAGGPHMRLVVQAPTYETYSETVELQKGANSKTIYLFRSEQGNEGEIQVQMLEGDAFFESGRAEIKPDALQKLIELGQHFKDSLQPDEVIVVQGHTDDVQYRVEQKSNWELSGERAASVCRVFQEPKYEVNIPGKQLFALGYGEFRPRVVLEPGDSEATISDKRAKNRRIEIRKLKGAEVFATGKL